MNEVYSPLRVDATADDILLVLRDIHRQQCAFDLEADPDISLSHDSTIAEWRHACDLLPWAKVAEALNAVWSVTIPMSRWRDVMEPAKKRRLGGVCELLAQYVKLPRVRPATVLGCCAPAGAFLTIRSYLNDAGADVTDVAPSTPLGEYTRRYAKVFLGPVSQLAPGALPLVKVRTPVYDSFVTGMTAALLGFIVAWLCASITIAEVSAIVFAICYIGVCTLGQWVLPASVDFPGLKTFRDMSNAIAAGGRTEVNTATEH